jgi:hypothetical protein
MTPANDAQHFAGLARENRLQISPGHAAEVVVFGAVLEAAYLTIREIGTVGFEPAALFVPAAPGVRTAQHRRHAGREST